MLKNLKDYFDILGDAKRRLSPDGGKHRPLHWLPQWIALFAGVVIQPYLSHYRLAHAWDFSDIGTWSVFSGIVAIVIFPGVYRRTIEATNPIFLQFCTIFTSGLGWQSLIGTAEVFAKK